MFMRETENTTEQFKDKKSTEDFFYFFRFLSLSQALVSSTLRLLLTLQRSLSSQQKKRAENTNKTRNKFQLN